MRAHFKLLAAAIGLSILSGCASVPMGSPEADAALKKFAPPPADQAGLYIYRDSFAGKALKKSVSVDGKIIGETANKVYFHQFLSPGVHTIGTESEFSDNLIKLNADAGKNYYVRQYIKMGAFVGGAGLEIVPEAIGQADVQKCELAASK